MPNEFIVRRPAPPPPERMVPGVMGISLQQLINDIRENRDGTYDRLYLSPQKGPPKGGQS